MFALRDVQIKFQMPLSDIDGNKYLFTENCSCIWGLGLWVELKTGNRAPNTFAQSSSIRAFQ